MRLRRIAIIAGALGGVALCIAGTTPGLLAHSRWARLSAPL
jgi:hypothetical protein